MQTRYLEYGGPFSARIMQAVLSGLLQPGVYGGFNLSVNMAGGIDIAAGTVLLPDGVVLVETDTRSVVFAPPAVATTYTLVATHTISGMSGGSPATYSLVAGLWSTYTDSAVLGWVRHPGGGVPLALTHITPSPKQLIDDYVRTVFGAYAAHYLDVPCDWDADGCTIVSTYISSLKYQSVHLGAAAHPHHEQTFWSTGLRPWAFTYLCDPGVSVVQMQVWDCAGVLFMDKDIPTDVDPADIVAPVFPSGSLQFYTLRPDAAPLGTWTDGHPFLVRTYVHLVAHDTLLFSRLRIDVSPLP